MKREARNQLMRCRSLSFWGIVVVLALVPMAVQAQRGGEGRGEGRGARLSSEDAKKAWALEAQHVAGKLELSKEAAIKLTEAFAAARTSYSKAMEAKREELRADTGDRSSRYAAYRKVQEEVTKAEREKLEKALAAFLNKEQVQKVLERLGSFSGQWDRMVHTLAGFELGEKQPDALELVNQHVVDQAKLFESVTGPGADFMALRDKFVALKEKLDKSLAPLLSEEQMTKWTEATTRQRGPRR
jgi:hypothetical protein